MTNSYQKHKAVPSFGAAFFVVLLFYEQAVVSAAVEDMIYINSVVLYLIKYKVPIFHIHFVIFVGRNAGFIKKRKTLRHMFR